MVNLSKKLWKNDITAINNKKESGVAMSLYDFDYTDIYYADTVAKSNECVYNRQMNRFTGKFCVDMKSGSSAEWKITVKNSGKYTITVKYSSDVDNSVSGALEINSEEKARIEFKPCKYYDRTSNQYRTGTMHCARAVLNLDAGENTVSIRLLHYEGYGVVSIDTISLSDGKLCEMRQPVYDIFDFIEESDRQGDCTAAFQRALDKCGEKGGTLYVHDGTYLIKGAVIYSNTTIYVDETAQIYGSSNQNEYFIHNVEHTYIHEYSSGIKALFYAEHADNIAITGGGLIGIKGGETTLFTGAEWERPTVITLISCNNIVISNIDIKESGVWNIILLECDNAIIDSINLDATYHTNRDGIDPVDSSNVFITNSAIASGDDVICLKSGTYKGVCNIHVKNCFLNSCGANGIKIGTSSYQQFKHCTFEDIVMRHINLAGISIGSADGADIEDIAFFNIKMSSIRMPVSILNDGGVRGRRIDGAPPKRGYIKNIVLENIYADKLINTYGSHIDGRNKDGVSDRVTDILLKNVHIECKGGHAEEKPPVPIEYNGGYPDYFWCEPTMPAYGLYVRHTDNISLVDCTFSLLADDVREAIVFDDCTNVVSENVSIGKNL